MRVFNGTGLGKIHVLRLDAGDYLLESICDFIRDQALRNAVVLSGIGTLDFCVLHMVMTTGYPPVEYFARWENSPLELSSISGIIAEGAPHLHMVVSDHKGAYSGHVEPGCRVLYLGEIVIAEMEGFRFSRIRNEKNILELTV
jgi:predicted DNA-binding protein with PD1-like motif